MSSNVVLFAWNRSVPGREAISGQHFQEFLEYLGVQKRNAVIESFDTVFLDPYGGTLNGFFLLRGDPAKLQQLIASPEWIRHQIRGLLHLEGAATLRGATGAAVGERMALWLQEIPK
ncbi:MAG TPA: hypothetical protein VN649_13075 [Ramlibacter sp.]|nr:hypothetical protein [Ramlibacter sp.]